MKLIPSRRATFWRLAISAVVFIWSVAELFPLRDRPIEQTFLSFAADSPQAQQLLESARTARENGSFSDFPSAILEISARENIDLEKLFPNLPRSENRSLLARNRHILKRLSQSGQAALRQGLDLKGGLSVTLEIAPESLAKNAHERTQQLEKVQEIMRRRIDGLGVVEPIIRHRGDSQIEVQLAGLSSRNNPDLLEIIRKPAKLEFRFLHPTQPFLQNKITQDLLPVGYELLPLESADLSGDDAIAFALVKRIPEMCGGAIKRAALTVNNYGAQEVNLELTADGMRKFERVTRENIGRQLGIVLDGKLYSAPVIRSAIPDGRASISGKFSQQQALELVNVLNNPLEFELRLAEVYELGPTLAEDVRRSSLNAALLGTFLVVFFMLAYYRLAGGISVISVLLNVVIVLGILGMLGATMTLPGVAALVLTVGMGVDANILIYSRMREELAAGKSLSQSLSGGYGKAFSTIFDANITTLLTAVILMFYGTGPVKGFGVILGIGVMATLFCALVFSRGLLELCVNIFGVKRLFSRGNPRHFAFNFMRWRKISLFSSWILIVIGLGAIGWKGSRVYGIDFTGGDELVTRFEKKIPTAEIRQKAFQNGFHGVEISYQTSLAEGGERLKIQTELGQGQSLLGILQEQFPEAQLTLLQETRIGGSVGSSIRWNALVGLLLSLLGILCYVAIRFELGFALGAIVSTIHDVLLTMGIFVLLGHQFSAPMVAAILMIVGYSINDTIVIFDRIREELSAHPQLSLYKVINLATNATLSRTLLTSFTTMMAAVALYVFGAGVIRDFSLIFIIGILTGTFSSIFVASPIFFWWHRGERRPLFPEKSLFHPSLGE